MIDCILERLLTEVIYLMCVCILSLVQFTFRAHTCVHTHTHKKGVFFRHVVPTQLTLTRHNVTKGTN